MIHCTCELRDRQWNPATGKCLRCGGRACSRDDVIDAAIRRQFNSKATPDLPFGDVKPSVGTQGARKP